MTDLLQNIAEYSVVVAVLVVAIIYFLRREKVKDGEITSLHSELRTSEKENLTALYKLLAFLEKMEEKDRTKSDFLLKEIKEMRKSLEEKIIDLK